MKKTVPGSLLERREDGFFDFFGCSVEERLLFDFLNY